MLNEVESILEQLYGSTIHDADAKTVLRAALSSSNPTRALRAANECRLEKGHKYVYHDFMAATSEYLCF